MAMGMVVDSRQQVPFHSMGYDNMRYPSGPQFSNPWVSAAPGPNQMYASALPAPHTSDVKHYASHASNAASAYPAVQLLPPIAAPGMLPLDPILVDHSGLPFAQDNGAARSYGGAYSSPASSTSSGYAPTSAPQYIPTYSYEADRRLSQSQLPNSMAVADHTGGQQQQLQQPQSSLLGYSNKYQGHTERERQSFSNALEASQGMVAMSQSDITPRNIYGNVDNARDSNNSYGFPTSHSSHSSVSSASTYPTYYNSSVSEASTGDYSSATESVDMPSSRTLPPPSMLLAGGLPPPQSMMGQFSSKVSSSSQKKHKCKVCEKRFTRPSSLQTHVYSHTGEKRTCHHLLLLWSLS